VALGSYGGVARVHRPGAPGAVHVTSPNNSSPGLTGLSMCQCLVRVGFSFKTKLHYRNAYMHAMF
jgi:hypothetical protein